MPGSVAPPPARQCAQPAFVLHFLQYNATLCVAIVTRGVVLTFHLFLQQENLGKNEKTYA